MDGRVSCDLEVVSAYIDGDLDAAGRTAFEEHLLMCKSCEEELRMQRLFMCELDSAIPFPDLPVPRDFARIVATKAESDMSGARNGTERKRALHFSLVLAALAFALLGTSASESLVTSARSVATKVVGVISLVGKFLFDVGVGLTLLLRIAGRAFSTESFSVLVFLVLLLAVLLLSLLISNYHRSDRYRIYE